MERARADDFERFQQQYYLNNLEDGQSLDSLDQRENVPREPERNYVDINKLFENMIIENKRRDAVIERLLDRLTLPTTNHCQTSPTQNLTIMPDLLRNIAHFNGDCSKASAWLQSLSSVQLLHGLPDAYMLETARTRLTDGAYHWYQTKANDILTWADFVEQFSATFMIK